jgi:serine/threonine protein phosphatase PrpC
MKVNILEDFPKAHQSIESLSGIKLLWSITKPIRVSIEERDIMPCPYSEKLWGKYCIWVDEYNKTEVIRTIDFLYTKFQILFPKIREKYRISEEEFLWNIVIRLVSQIQEAFQSGRKFTNGIVGSLKSIDWDGNISLEKIPYWAFWSTNVSLDYITYQTHSGEKTLREVMEEVEELNETGESYLPNSLGVSVMIQLSDGTIIWQKRNNQTTLTQYAGLVSSASGTVSILDSEESGWTELLHANAIAEVNEELGLHPGQIPHLPHIDYLSENIQERLLREINLDTHSWVLIPIGIVMERKRHNPEVVFSMILHPEITLHDIKDKWEHASDKWESIDLVAKTPNEIEADILLYENALPENLKTDPNGLEKYIQTLDPWYNWAGPHLLMSYLTWKGAIERMSLEKRSQIQNLLESKERMNILVDSLEFPGSQEKPSEDRMLINHDAWIYGVFDGATSLDGFHDQAGISGGAIAAEVARMEFQSLKKDENLVQWISHANESINTVMLQNWVNMVDKTRRFGSTVSLVKLEKTWIEYLNIGDSTIIIEFADWTIQIIQEEQDHDQEALQKWDEFKQQWVEDVRKHPRIVELLGKIRNQSNITYSVLNGEVIPDTLFHSWIIPNPPNNPIKNIALFTDGFEVPSYWKDKNWATKFMKKLTSKDGLEQIKDMIALETEWDPDCVKYPRFKKQDDWTCVLIRFL